MRLLERHLAFRLVVTVVGAATAVLLVAALVIGLVSIKRTEEIVADDIRLYPFPAHSVYKS